MNYNIDMARRFTKRHTKRTRIKLSPQEADEIIRAEFSDEKKGRHRFRLIFKPHTPQEGDMTLDYNTEKGNE